MKARASGNIAETESPTTSDATIGTNLEQLIKKKPANMIMKIKKTGFDR
jgi:hypothetical protein